MIQNTLLFMYLVYDPYSLLDGTICTNVVIHDYRKYRNSDLYAVNALN